MPNRNLVIITAILLALPAIAFFTLPSATILRASLLLVASFYMAGVATYLSFNSEHKSPLLGIAALLISMLIVLAGFSSIYEHTGLIEGNTVVKGDGNLAIYFSAVTWSTLGYGDIQPAADSRAIAAAQAMIGYVYMGLLTTVILSWLLGNKNDSPRHEMLSSALASGLVNIRPECNYSNLFQSLRKGDELLWLDTYSMSYSIFMRDLGEAAARGAALKIMVIKPNSEVARLRALEIEQAAFDDESFSSQSQAFIDAMIKTVENAQGNNIDVEIRTYSGLPGVPMYLVRRKNRPAQLITGFYLNRPSDNEWHIDWNPVEGGMLFQFEDYFRDKWQRDGEPVFSSKGD